MLMTNYEHITITNRSPKRVIHLKQRASTDHVLYGKSTNISLNYNIIIIINCENAHKCIIYKEMGITVRQ